MTQRLALILAPLLLLAACGPKPKPADLAPAAPAAESGPTAKVDRFTPYESGPLDLDEYAVGPIMGQTAFTLEAIKARFPKAQVKSAFLHEAQGVMTPIITVDQDGMGMLEIAGEPGAATVGTIRVAGGPAKGPRGETLLMKWTDADLDVSRCRIGEGRERHAVVCSRLGEPVLRYVFGVPGWTQDVMPPVETLRQKAILSEFVWKGAAPIAAPGA
ncbi:MAG: hypothetical protein JWP92_2857 [Caulobacter sp.]|nr:hypothetical protein [Caulobacter sp.]